LNQISSDPLIAIGSIPHSWMFQPVSAVCHHGGGGITSSGSKAGVIILFSNDQFAWNTDHMTKGCCLKIDSIMI